MKQTLTIEFLDTDAEEQHKILIDRENIFFAFHTFVSDLHRYMEHNNVPMEQVTDVCHLLTDALRQHGINSLDDYHY